jgi:hypothetical protein
MMQLVDLEGLNKKFAVFVHLLSLLYTAVISVVSRLKIVVGEKNIGINYLTLYIPCMTASVV